MKYLVTIFVLIAVLSCKQKGNQSLEPLMVDYIDDIPFLLTQKKLDSVFEIVTFGQINNLMVRDTLNYYWLTDKNTISQKHSGFMCCSNTFLYDSSGLLITRHKFSDYSEYFTSDFMRNEDYIIETETSNLGSKINYKYDLKNELLVAKTGEALSEATSFETSTFEYNSKKQLAVKMSKMNSNDPESGVDYSKIITIYSWDEAMLSETNEKSYYPNGIDYYETITKFDSEGFPASKIIKKNMDTVCKTIIKRF